MTKKIMAFIILLLMVSVEFPKAITINECKVIAMFKIQSSDDEELNICEGQSYTSSNISYSGTGTKINIADLNAYYLKVENAELELTGSNNISLLQTNSKIKVSGKGNLKFKEASFVKKTKNGQPVYSYEYNNKVLTKDKKTYEATQEEFELEYDNLKEENKLPKEFNIEDYKLYQVEDFSQMNSLIINEIWLEKNIETELTTKVINGYGYIEYIEPNNSQLESENVVLISEKEVKKDYKLEVSDLKDEKELTTKINDNITDKSLLGLYDVTVYNKKKQVVMQSGEYTIKIKLDSPLNEYTDYQIIYVDETGEIKEYLNANIEDGYIVFNTNHLSQYGVVAKPIEPTIIETYQFKDPLYKFKIFILVLATVSCISIIGMIFYQNNKRTSKKRRA